MVSEYYGYNILCMYFQKPTVKIRINVHIRTIVVLTCGKLTEFYFLYLLYVIYYSVTTHL
jgi:hypothetical protein